ncbi:MAG: 5'-nucleotidase C-terminal domain-containing protein [Spirochaetaceae bacterium]|nr:5'-nucleotidase C-terminal domain-containing protein [Spirochaetaceae bacterium]
MKTKKYVSLPALARALCLALLVAQAGCDNPSTTPDPGILYPPPNLISFQLTPGDGFIEVRFTMVATATNGYRIYWNAAENPAGASHTDVPQPDTQLVYCKIEGLQNGQQYHVWAEARYPDGYSALSASISASPRAKPQSPPGGFTAHANDGALDLTWNLVDDADSYIVYWNTTGGAEPPEGSESAEFYDGGVGYRDVMGHIGGLTNSTTYNIWIRANNTSGVSEGCTAGTGTPAAAGGAPVAPNMPFLTALDKSLRVEWNAVKGATSYKLYYGETNDTGDASEAANTTPESISAGAGKMSATILGLTNGTTYYVWVKALNGSTESDFSSSNNETPKSKPPLNTSNPSFLLGNALALFPNAEAGKGDRLSRKQETALGDLVADSMLEWADNHKGTYEIDAIDFAFVNGGVIVNSMDKGSITVGTVTKMLHPEGDKMSIVRMTGTRIKSLFHDYVAKVRHDGGGGNGTGAFGQVSKQVRYTIDYNYDSKGGVIYDLKFYNGEAWVDFVDDQIYHFITNSYLLYGAGDGYGPIMSQGTETKTGILISVAVCEWIYARGEISPTTDGRITLKREVWK